MKSNSIIISGSTYRSKYSISISVDLYSYLRASISPMHPKKWVSDLAISAPDGVKFNSKYVQSCVLQLIAKPSILKKLTTEYQLKLPL